MKQCDLTKGLVVFLTIIITLFCGVMPSSWAETPNCDYCEGQKFKGCYGFSHDGMMQMVSGQLIGQTIPMASVGVFYLDNQGNLTGQEIVNCGGNSFPANISGTFTVNSDCTGTATICATPENDQAIESEISFVITGCNFDEIQMVTTKMTFCDSGGVVAAIPLNIVGIAKKQSCDDQQ